MKLQNSLKIISERNKLQDQNKEVGGVAHINIERQFIFYLATRVFYHEKIN